MRARLPSSVALLKLPWPKLATWGLLWQNIRIAPAFDLNDLEFSQYELAAVRCLTNRPGT